MKGSTVGSLDFIVDKTETKGWDTTVILQMLLIGCLGGGRAGLL